MSKFLSFKLPSASNFNKFEFSILKSVFLLTKDFKSLLKFIDPKARIKPLLLTSKLVLIGIFLIKSFELPIKTWLFFFVKFNF